VKQLNKYLSKLFAKDEVNMSVNMRQVAALSSNLHDAHVNIFLRLGTFSFSLFLSLGISCINSEAAVSPEGVKRGDLLGHYPNSGPQLG
jgi:hypothetical protein